jgi:BolA protein
MTIESKLREKVQQALFPEHLEIENESANHHRDPNGETHFKLLIVSSKFEGKTRVDRQRMVQSLFEEERTKGLHALTMKTLTPSEWEKDKSKLNFESPTCASTTTSRK